MFQSHSLPRCRNILKVTEDGSRITGTRGLLAIFPLVWIPEAKAEKLRSHPKEPILAPIVPGYTMQPMKQGRLVRFREGFLFRKHCDRFSSPVLLDLENQPLAA